MQKVLIPVVIAAAAAGASFALMAPPGRAPAAMKNASPTADASVAASIPGAVETLATTLEGSAVFLEPRLMPNIAIQHPDGHGIRWESFKGKALLVNLWATWCPPCIKEMPALNRLQRDLGGEDFAVVTITMDKGGSPVAQSWFDDNEIDALIAYSEESWALAKTVEARGLPMTLFVDATGHAHVQFPGSADWDAPWVRSAIEGFIAGVARS